MLNEDIESIVQEGKSRFKRLFSAKRHRDELQHVADQLEMAKSDYMVRDVSMVDDIVLMISMIRQR